MEAKLTLLAIHDTFLFLEKKENADINKIGVKIVSK